MKDFIKILYYNKQQFIEFRDILSTTLSTLVRHLWPILIIENAKNPCLYQFEYINDKNKIFLLK